MRRKKDDLMWNMTDVRLAKHLFLTAMYCRYNVSSLAYSELVMAAALIHGRENFFFNVKEFAPANLTTQEWKSVKKIVHDEGRRLGYFVMENKGRNMVLLSLTQKGRERADDILKHFKVTRHLVVKEFSKDKKV